MSEANFLLGQEIEKLEMSSGESFDEKAEQVISELKQNREQIYIDIFDRANQLQFDKKLKPKQFYKVYEKLASTYRNETKLPLELLILDREINLTEQYSREKQILEASGLIKPISTGELGIISYDGTEAPLPQLEQIAEHIPIEKILEIQKKKAQGFTRLLISPFGMPLLELINIYQRNLTEFEKQSKLFDSKGNPLHVIPPQGKMAKITIGGPYMAGESQSLFSYYPSLPRVAFNPSLMPKSKPKSAYRPFNVLLVENLDEAVEVEKGEILSERKQLEGKQTPYAYFSNLLNQQYKGEVGFTLEDWLALAISKLHSENILINRETNSICLGTFLPKMISFPLVYARDEFSGTNFDSINRDDGFSNSSPRMGVRLFK